MAGGGAGSGSAAGGGALTTRGGAGARAGAACFAGAALVTRAAASGGADAGVASAVAKAWGRIAMVRTFFGSLPTIPLPSRDGTEPDCALSAPFGTMAPDALSL